MFRIFSLLNPKQPVDVVCEICRQEIKVERHRSKVGEQWIDGIELYQAWLDHQLLNCKEVDDEGSIRG